MKQEMSFNFPLLPHAAWERMNENTFLYTDPTWEECPTQFKDHYKEKQTVQHGITCCQRSSQYSLMIIKAP